MAGLDEKSATETSTEQQNMAQQDFSLWECIEHERRILHVLGIHEDNVGRLKARGSLSSEALGRLIKRGWQSFSIVDQDFLQDMLTQFGLEPVEQVSVPVEIDDEIANMIATRRRIEQENLLLEAQEKQKTLVRQRQIGSLESASIGIFGAGFLARDIISTFILACYVSLAGQKATINFGGEAPKVSTGICLMLIVVAFFLRKKGWTVKEMQNWFVDWERVMEGRLASGIGVLCSIVMGCIGLYRMVKEIPTTSVVETLYNDFGEIGLSSFLMVYMIHKHVLEKVEEGGRFLSLVYLLTLGVVIFVVNNGDGIFKGTDKVRVILWSLHSLWFLIPAQTEILSAGKGYCAVLASVTCIGVVIYGAIAFAEVQLEINVGGLVGPQVQLAHIIEGVSVLVFWVVGCVHVVWLWSSPPIRRLRFKKKKRRRTLWKLIQKAWGQWHGQVYILVWIALQVNVWLFVWEQSVGSLLLMCFGGIGMSISPIIYYVVSVGKYGMLDDQKGIMTGLGLLCHGFCQFALYGLKWPSACIAGISFLLMVCGISVAIIASSNRDNEAAVAAE